MKAHKHVFFAIGPYCWGKADTPDEAVRNMRKNWATVYAGNFSKSKYALYLAPETAEVHEVTGDLQGIYKDCPDCRILQLPKKPKE